MSKTVDDVRAVIDRIRLALITVKVASSTKLAGFAVNCFCIFGMNFALLLLYVT